MCLVSKYGKTLGYVTLYTRMALMNYTLFDILLHKDNPVPEINHNVNLSNTVISGVNLALYDGGANGYIKGNNMRVLHYNSNGRRVSIGIAGDQQLTDARLCTGVSIAKTIQCWSKLIWNQCAVSSLHRRTLSSLTFK